MADESDQLGLTAAYRDRRPAYERFTEELRRLLERLLAAKSVVPSAILARTKEVSSFAGKVGRPQKRYTALEDITDLTGVRIVLHTIADAQAASDVVRAEFDVDDRSIDKITELGPTELGYLSVHFIVRLKGDRRTLPEYAAFAGMCGEIQVRTVLQDAWAAVDHKLRYKGREEVPSHLARRLYRLMALMELADQEFAAIASDVQEHQGDVLRQVEASNLKIPLDLDSLSSYISSSPFVSQISQAGFEAGFKQIGSDDVPYPDSGTLAEILAICRRLSLDAVDQLDARLKSVGPLAETYFRTLIKGSLSSWTADGDFFVALLLMHTTEKLAREDFADWSPEILDRVIAAIADTKRTGR